MLLSFFLKNDADSTDDLNEGDLYEYKRAAYRYGKRAAMPYRFGRKRNWQVDQPADSQEHINLRLSPAQFAKYLRYLNEKNDYDDDEGEEKRAAYRYGRK